MQVGMNNVVNNSPNFKGIFSFSKRQESLYPKQVLNLANKIIKQANLPKDSLVKDGNNLHIITQPKIDTFISKQLDKARIDYKSLDFDYNCI